MIHTTETSHVPKGIRIGTVPMVEIVYAPPTLQFSSPLLSSEVACEFFRRLYDPRKICLKEFFYIALVNHANFCIGYSLIGIGHDRGVLVHIKEVIQLAILSNAAGIFICHNHPSGSMSPSKEDTTLTQNIKAGAKFFDIELVDHIILTHDSYYSFADEGLI